VAERSEQATTTPRSTAPADGLDAPPPAAPTWKVEPGDHFWSIAQRLLADSWGRRPSASEVDPYWRVLIEANRGRLADRTNPDLLFPGQLLVLPPIPLRPAA
jgi:nucleoid-associated protein YgaU